MGSQPEYADLSRICDNPFFFRSFGVIGDFGSHFWNNYISFLRDTVLFRRLLRYDCGTH